MQRVFLLALLCACGPRSGKEVSGDIGSDTTWALKDSPIVVTANLSVRGGKMLTIEAGCLVRFKPGTSLTVAAGALRVNGTRNDPVVFTSESETPQPGAWDGLYFNDGNDDARTRLENLQISGAGGGEKGAAIEVTGALVEMLSVSVTGAQKTAIFFGEEGGFGPTSTALVVSGAKEYGVSVLPNFAGTLPKSASSYTGNMLGAVEIRGGDVTTTQSWRHIGAPWIVTGDLNIAGGSSPVLTLEGGVELDFADGKGFSVGANGSGGLRTIGANGQNVVLSSVRKDRGAWRGLSMNPPSARLSTLSYTRIENAGGNAKAALVLNGVQPTLQNVSVTESSSDGILFTGPSLTSQAELATGSTAVVSRANTGVGVRMPANAVGSIPADGCDFGSNGVAGVLVENGLIRKTQTWQAINVPYELAADLVVGQSINAETILTLQAGVTIAFRKGFGLLVGRDKARGSLRALGQPSKRVLLTSAEGMQQPGDWAGVRIYDTAVASASTGSYFKSTTIRYAGAAENAALTVDAPMVEPLFDDTLVQYGGGYGACIVGADTATALASELTSGRLTLSALASGNFCPNP